jgi:hypothetical protein
LLDAAMELTALEGTTAVGIMAACKIDFSRLDHWSPSTSLQQQSGDDGGGQYECRDEHTEPEHQYHL